MQFSEIFNFLDSAQLTAQVLLSLYVWVSDALVDRVTNLFAADAPDILQKFGGFCFLVSAIFISFLVVLALVFGVFAAGLILASFTTAPPHLTAPVRLVSATRPVEIFFLQVFIRTIFTCFYAVDEISFTGCELDQPFFQFFPFLSQNFDGSVELHALFNMGFYFLTCGFIQEAKPLNFLFGGSHDNRFLKCQHRFWFFNFSGLLSVSISFKTQIGNLLSFVFIFRN